MKKLLVILFLPVLMSTMNAQTTSDIFGSSETEITWVGLDFTRAMLVGSEGFTDPGAIRDRFFASWNNLIINEPTKYDLNKTFMKSNIENDIVMMIERNEKVDYANIVTNKSSAAIHLEEGDIQDIVSEFSTSGSGIGLTFIVESFDKLNNEANIYITFFNMDTKKVLFAERMTGKARGFGFRNFWAGAIYHILVQIQKKQYKKWANEYGG